MLVSFLSTGDPQSGCTRHSCETVDGMMQELHKAPTKQIHELPKAQKKAFYVKQKNKKEMKKLRSHCSDFSEDDRDFGRTDMYCKTFDKLRVKSTNMTASSKTSCSLEGSHRLVNR